MIRSLPHSLFLLCMAAGAAFAHDTWIAASGALATGKPVTIFVRHGHHFPASEEAVNAAQLDLFAQSASGKRTALQASVQGREVVAEFTPAAAGAHTLAFTQDRGVTSRTPKGVKQGGRDKNPGATQSSRTLRTAVAYLGAAVSKPAGLEVEIVGTLSGGAWTVQLLRGGKPLAGIAIEAFPAGAEAGKIAGKTDANGKLRYTPEAGARKDLLFIAEFKQPAPQGSAYDTVNFETSLHVSW